jgi:amidophosphoribosyltransferase
LIFQDLDDLFQTVNKRNADLQRFDASVFNGQYVTGDVNTQYLDQLQQQRSDTAKQARRESDEEVIEMHNTA